MIKCNNCGSECEDSKVFCGDCGSRLDILDSKISITNINSKKESLKGNKKKTIIITSIISIFIIGLILFLIPIANIKDAFFATGDIKEKSYLPIYYIKERELYSVNKNLEKEKISNPIYKEDKYGLNKYTAMLYVQMSEARNIVYFLEDFSDEAKTGTLFVKEIGKDKTKIADNVGMFRLSKNGKSILFLQDYSSDKDYGELYLKSFGNDKQKIASDICPNNFNFDINNKDILLIQDYSNEQKVGDLYSVKPNGEKELISKDVHNFIFNDKYILLNKNFKYDEKNYISTSDLYIKEKCKEPSIVTKESYSTNITKNGGLYTIGNYDINKKIGDLYYYENGKETIKIDSGVINYRIDEENDTKLLYIKPTDDKKNIGDLYLKDRTSDSKRIAQDINYRNWQFDTNSNTIWYIDNYNDDTLIGTLNKIVDSNGNYQKQEVSNNVFEYSIDKLGITFLKNLDKNKCTSDLYAIRNTDNKETLISNSVGVKKFNFDNSFYSKYKVDDCGLNVIFFDHLNETNGLGDLYIKPIKDGQEKNLISRDVSESYFFTNANFNQIFYLKGFNKDKGVGDFYVKIETNEPIKIDNDVTQILFDNNIY